MARHSRNLLILLCFLLLYAQLVEPNWIEISRHEVYETPTKQLRIAHITDMHSTGNGYREKWLVDKLALEEPDLILVTGDSNKNAQSYKTLQAFWQKLSAPLGIWKSRGNWENWYPEQSNSRDISSRAETTLVNRAIELTKNIWLIGLDDASSGQPDLSVLSKVPADSFKIVMSHSPALFDEIASMGCNLVLSGHSHGGQVRIPGWGPLWLPEGVGSYVGGWYEKNSCKMFVSRGIGTSILPIRFFARPELAIISLRP